MPSWMQTGSFRAPDGRRLPGGERSLGRRVLRRAREAVLRDPECLGELLCDERSLRLIFHESRIANRILLSPQAMSRIVQEAEFLATLAESDSLLDYLRRHPQLLGRLLDDDEMIAKIAADERFTDHLLDDPALRSRVLDHADLEESIASHPRVIAAMVRSARGNVPLREALLADPSSLERIVGDERVLRALLDQPPTLDRILLSDRARIRMRANRRFVDQLVEDSGFVAELFLDPRVVKKLMSNRMLLRGLLQEEEVQTAVLECMPCAPPSPRPRASEGVVVEEPPDLVDLLQRPEIAHLFVQDDRLLGGLLADTALRERIVAHPLLRETRADREARRAIARAVALPPGSPEDEAALARSELTRYWNEFAPHLDPQQPETAARFERALARIEQRDQVADTLEQILAEDGRVRLREAELDLVAGGRLVELLYPVLVERRYAFDAASDAPRVLDCGSQAGLATFGFKCQYPNARITAVEPAPTLRQAARANLKALGHEDVESLANALACERASLPFLLGSGGRGGRLIPNASRERAAGKRINVRARPLSDLLRDRVDYLKLDVAGSEVEILEHAEGQLANVRQIFVEVHDGGDDFGERLARLFALLRRSGYETHVVPRLGPIRPNRDAVSRSDSSSREAFGVAARRVG